MRVCQSLRLVCQISYSQCISNKLPFVLFGFFVFKDLMLLFFFTAYFFYISASFSSVYLFSVEDHW